VVFYSAWIFFDGAYRALRARTLDMMVLVAVAVGAGWGYSLVVTLTGVGQRLSAGSPSVWWPSSLDRRIADATKVLTDAVAAPAPLRKGPIPCASTRNPPDPAVTGQQGRSTGATVRAGPRPA
jgi:hypothetical protein